MRKARVLRIDYRPTLSGKIQATCEDYQALHVVAEKREHAAALVTQTLERLHALTGNPIRALEVDGGLDEDGQSFVLVPLEALSEAA